MGNCEGAMEEERPLQGKETVLHRDKGESRIGELSGEEYEREW